MSSCIEWQGQQRNGYGSLRFNGKQWYAHRLMYVRKYGNILDSQVIRHKCNKPLCVNIDHLIIGTQQDNMADMIKSGNSLRGSKNINAKLTEDQAMFIKNSKMKGVELAQMFGVSKHTISKIKTGVNWFWL